MSVTGQVDEVEASSPLGLASYRYPTGWYVVAWADDIAPGEVRPVHYFGRDLVVWRTASGRLRVMDAYCLHLGGNLSVGGHVEGEELVCPWHAWHWGADGSNTLIPYSRERCKSHLRIDTFAVLESGSTATVGSPTGNRRWFRSSTVATTTPCTRTPGCSTG
jgi:phenylpropionate dioxygenase-like ring-hydroxylating dioxygenase large terminal subunit